MFMHIKKHSVDTLYQKTSENFEKYSDYVDTALMNNYQQLLNDIAARSNYNEGDEIKKEDLDEINTFVSQAYDSVSANAILKAANLSHEERTLYDSLMPMISVSDQMFAMALKTLGCPNIPVGFGNDMKNKFNTNVKDSTAEVRIVAYSSINAEAHYNSQRKQDAWEIVQNNSELISRLEEASKPTNKLKASKMDMSIFIAEYKALKKRQEGHGRIWRWFHREENAAREELLSRMEDMIKGFAGKDVNLELPIHEIMKNYDDKKLDRSIKIEQEYYGLETRTKIQENLFRYKSEKPAKATSNDINKESNDITVSANIDSQSKENVEREVEPVSPKILPLLNNPIVKQELVDEIMSQLPENTNPKVTPEKTKALLSGILNGSLLTVMVVPVCSEFDQAMTDGKDLTAAMESVVSRVQWFAKSSAPVLDYTEDKLTEQAITVMRDAILKKFSPVAVAPEKLGDFANKYVERFPKKFDEEAKFQQAQENAKQNLESIIDDDESEYVPDYSSSSSSDSESNIDEEIRESISFLNGEFEDDKEIDLSSVVSNDAISKSNPKIEK